MMVKKASKLLIFVLLVFLIFVNSSASLEHAGRDTAESIVNDVEPDHALTDVANQLLVLENMLKRTMSRRQGQQKSQRGNNNLRNLWFKDSAGNRVYKGKHHGNIGTGGNNGHSYGNNNQSG